MNSLSDKILKELLPVEPDADALAATALAKQKKTALQSDHWSSAVLLERGAYLHKLAKAGNGSAGETRGTSIDGGAPQELRAGDVAHVPAGLPHQMLVAADKTVTCLVMKIQENQ